MKFPNIISPIIVVSLLLFGCNSKQTTPSKTTTTTSISYAESDAWNSCSPRVLKRNKETGLIPLDATQKQYLADNLKSLNPDLPLIGLLMYDDVLTTELTAPMDVFTKLSEDGEALFNVITIAEDFDFIVSEEGLKMFPDYTIKNCPKLDVLIVPSAYDMSLQVKNENLVNFIKAQNNNTEFTVSNCAGASLIGESGIANGHRIVTWIGGGEDLQKNYPDLKVQDDSKVSFVEDGKFLSSNGNLASYISSLELLEKMTSKEHRKFVESYLYLDRLQGWQAK